MASLSLMIRIGKDLVVCLPGGSHLALNVRSPYDVGTPVPRMREGLELWQWPVRLVFCHDPTSNESSTP